MAHWDVQVSICSCYGNTIQRRQTSVLPFRDLGYFLYLYCYHLPQEKERFVVSLKRYCLQGQNRPRFKQNVRQSYQEISVSYCSNLNSKLENMLSWAMNSWCKIISTFKQLQYFLIYCVIQWCLSITAEREMACPSCEHCQYEKEFLSQITNWIILKLKFHTNIEKSKSVQLKSLFSFFPKSLCFIYKYS